MVYDKENEVVQSILHEVLRSVHIKLQTVDTWQEKTVSVDVVSAVDTDADDIIVKGLKKAFLNEVIITEETSPELLPQAFAGKRVWIVDPICGSLNAAHGLNLIATNITLVEKKKAVAAWVADHALNRVIWSTGSGVFIGGEKCRTCGNNRSLIIETNDGKLYSTSKETQQRYAQLAKDLILTKNVSMRKLDTSLDFAYVATGQINAAITINIEPWDLHGACFLVEQNGGIVTNFDGSPWTLSTKSAVMAANKEVHAMLLGLVKKNGLENVE